MSDFIHKLFTSYQTISDSSNRVGELNRIWYDSATNTFRIQLDDSPGGTVIGGSGGGSGSNYILPTATTTVRGGVKIDGITIAIDNTGVISVGTVPYSSVSGAPSVPTKVSQLTNDTGFITGVSWSQVTGKPTLFSGAYTDLTGKPTLVTSYNQLTDLPTLVTSYTQLTNLPVLFSGSYTDLTNKPVLFSGSYTDLTNKPTLVTSYTQLTDLPTLVTSYTQLTNLPTLFSGSYTDLTNKPILFSGDYADLTNKPTLVTSYNQLTDLPTLVTSYTQLTNRPTLFSGSYTDLTNKPTLFSGSYDDLTNKPAITTVTKLDDLSDVDLTTPPTIGQVLKYDGTKWAAGNDATSGGAGTDADTLDGFDSTYFLNYNNLTNKPTIPTTVTVNGTSITLGSSGTVTANTTNALTVGLGLKGTASTFNGSAAVTVSLDTSTTSIVATSGATTTLDAATLTRNYNITGSLSGTHIIKLPDLTTLQPGQQITFFTSQAVITYQLSTGTLIFSNSVATARQTTFTVVSNAANTTANISYTQIVSGLTGTGTSLVTSGGSVSLLYVQGSLDSTVTATAYQSTPTLTIGAGSNTFSQTINIANVASLATYTKTLNLGTGLAGGTSTINIGTGVTSGTATLNLGSTTTTTTMNGAVTITSLTATNSIVGSITGNAATATKLATARTINNVSFDGTAGITITATTPNYLTIGTGLTGTSASFDGSSAVTIAIDQTVALKSNTTYVGTTAISLSRASASQTLTGVSIDGNSATVTNGVYTTGTYANPSWITSLAYNKLTGTPSLFSGSYVDLTNKPTIYSNAYIGTTNLDFTRASASQTLTGVNIDGNSATVTDGLYSTGSYANPAWLTSLAYSKLTGAPTVPTNVSQLTNDSGYITSTGNTATATKLATARDINGVSFDGSADISIPSILAVAGTYGPGLPFRSAVTTDTTSGVTITTATGVPLAQTLKNWVFGFNGNLTFPDSSVQSTAYTATAVKDLFSVTTNSASGGGSLSYSNGVFAFAPASIPTYSVNTASANSTGGLSLSGTTFTFTPKADQTSVTGNAGTATTLQTARNINGVSFNGSADITVTAAAGTLTGTTLNSTVVSSSLTSVGTLTSLDSSGLVTLSYTGAGSVSTLSVNGYNSKGGTGYHDFLKATNGYGSATNPSKWFRINSVGTLEILNNSYNATVFSVTDNGYIAINGSSGATNGVPVNNGIAMNNNSYIYDDGNYHITTKSGQIWLNSNDGSAVSINQQVPSGTAAGGLRVTGPVQAQTAHYVRTGWNAAIDTEITVDNYRFRVSNSGGIFPQIISNTGGTVNSAWTAVAAISGTAITQTGSTGTLVPNGSWTSLYTSHGMDSSGDTVTITLQDKSAGRIYRVTFMRSDSGSVGYNIIAERLL